MTHAYLIKSIDNQLMTTSTFFTVHMVAYQWIEFNFLQKFRR